LELVYEIAYIKSILFWRKYEKITSSCYVSLSTVTTAALAEIKVGIILGFTGPIESLTLL